MVSSRLWVCSAVTIALLAGTSFGAIVAADDFNGYTNGDLAGQGSAGAGWGGAWTPSAPSDTGEVTVVDGGLSYNAGGITINGGSKAVQMIDSTGAHQIMRRPFPAYESDEEYYFSFLMKPSAGTLGSGDAGLVGFQSYYNNAYYDGEGAVGIYGDTFQGDAHIGSGADLTPWSSTFTMGETYLVVARYWKDPNGAYLKDGTYNYYDRYNTLQVWINPDTTDGLGTHDFASVWPVTSLPKSGDLTGAQLWAWNTLDDGDAILVDEFVMGETWGDVIPEPASLALLGFGGLALLRRRK